MPFGTVSAVYAWHRIGHMLKTIVLRLFKAPMARFVDDFFGASRVGVKLTGGVLFSILASLLGFPTDPAKDSDQCSSMIVLGACCTADFSRKVLNTHVEPAKAAKCLELLRGVLDAGTLAPGDASKLAGRLSFSVLHKALLCSNACPFTRERPVTVAAACRRVVYPILVQRAVV